MSQFPSKIRSFFSLVTFAHTVFALPFALVGLFIATSVHGYPFDWMQLVDVMLCMIFARNAAMGFNRYIDRKHDAANQRTAEREIPIGKISPREALWFIIGNAIAFFIVAAGINTLVLFLSPIALLVILGYSYTKRFTAASHLILGIGLSFAPIGAYLTVTAKFDVLPLLFSLLVMTWVAGFDIIYSMQDQEYDRQNKLHSIPALTGKRKALIISTFLHMITAFTVLFAGYYAGFGWFYYIGSGIFISLLIYQHKLVKPNDISRVNRAFGTTNGIASVVFAIFFLLEVLL